MDKISTMVIDLANKHFEDFKIRNGQVVPTYCPFCGGGDSHDKNTFAVGLYNGAYQCLRGSCGVKGSFRQLKEHYGELYDDFEDARVLPIAPLKKKSFDLPDESDLKPLTDEITTYFALRGISEETLEAFKIAADENGNIVFPFYRDGVLTYVKYRKPKKFVKGNGPKEWQKSNTEPILFGMDNAAFNMPLVITEGEIDTLSLYEAGVHNVVSVPCGCNNMDWIEICYDWLEKFQQIILFGDADEPGLEMVHTLTKRLGEERCLIPSEYPRLIVDGQDLGRSCKDANEILFAYGPEALKQLVDDCQPAPVEGVLNVASILDVDPASLPRIKTNIYDLDRAIGGFGEGSLTVISGKRGEGK